MWTVNFYTFSDEGIRETILTKYKQSIIPKGGDVVNINGDVYNPLSIEFDYDLECVNIILE